MDCVAYAARLIASSLPRANLKAIDFESRQTRAELKAIDFEYWQTRAKLKAIDFGYWQILAVWGQSGSSKLSGRPSGLFCLHATGLPIWAMSHPPDDGDDAWRRGRFACPLLGACHIYLSKG